MYDTGIYIYILARLLVCEGENWQRFYGKKKILNSIFFLFIYLFFFYGMNIKRCVTSHMCKFLFACPCD